MEHDSMGTLAIGTRIETVEDGRFTKAGDRGIVTGLRQAGNGQWWVEAQMDIARADHPELAWNGNIATRACNVRKVDES